MSRFSNDSHSTVPKEQVYDEAWQHFAQDLKQFPQSHQALNRVERNLSMIAMAASIAAETPAPAESAIVDDAETYWHKSTDLMNHIYLCYRRIAGETEYAVMEHFPAVCRNEIWNRGRNAVEVLREFTKEQRQALEVWANDIREEVKEFLLRKCPDHDAGRLADDFTRRFGYAVQVQTNERLWP